MYQKFELIRPLLATTFEVSSLFNRGDNIISKTINIIWIVHPNFFQKM